MLEGIGGTRKGGNNIVDNMTKSPRKTRQIRILEKQWKRLKIEAIERGITMSKLLEEKLNK